MKFHLHVSKDPPGRWDARLCTFILLASFACATFFASQCAAQLRIGRDIGGPAQDAASLVSSATATPAETDISAPVPDAEEASSVSPATNSLFSLAQEGGQSSSSLGSSSQSSSATTAPAKAPAARPKSPHHGLGIALAVVGTAALTVGIAAYALGGADICANEKSGGCHEARDAGLILMPVGAGVAITGFYLQFHR